MSSIVGSKDNLVIASKIASKSITLVKDINNEIPIKPEKIKSLAPLILTTDDNGYETLKTFRSNINYTHGQVKNIFVNYLPLK